MKDHPASASVEERRRERERWHMELPQRLAPVKQPDREKAKKMMQKAVYEGILTPWPVCAVPECNQRHVQAHFVSYDPFFWLQVVWLCRHHHRKLHDEHRARILRGEYATRRFPD